MITSKRQLIGVDPYTTVRALTKNSMESGKWPKATSGWDITGVGSGERAAPVSRDVFEFSSKMQGFIHSFVLRKNTCGQIPEPGELNN